MATDDQELLAKISALAGKLRPEYVCSLQSQLTFSTGQINRHKSAQIPDHQNSSSRGGYRGGNEVRFAIDNHATDRHEGYSEASSGWRPSRGSYSSRGYTRRGRPQVHRNRTLVLNSNVALPANDENEAHNSDGHEAPPASAATPPGWVTKTDRHLQLINTSIFEKESQNRAKAMEETRKQKLRQRDEIEKSKLNKHLNRSSAVIGYGIDSRAASQHSIHEINVQGIQFRIAKDGSKLVKVPSKYSLYWRREFRLDYSSGISLLCLGDLNAAKATPKVVMVGGVKFYRSKNGNLFRAGIIKAHRYGRPLHHHFIIDSILKNTDVLEYSRSGVVKKIHEPCKMFTTTGNPLPQIPYWHCSIKRRATRVSANTSFLLLGTCSKGPRCRYVHDPSKVAVCKEFLLRSSCPSGDSCDLSHDLTPERTPFCVHFGKGNCSNPSCHYAHVRVSPGALVCAAFGRYGYCEKGSSCSERHVHECPDFSNTGKCTTKGCKLPHRHKASVMRATVGSADEDNSDLSSDDEEDEIDSDDVDSDDLDGEFMNDGEPDLGSFQQDFVKFS